MTMQSSEIDMTIMTIQRTLRFLAKGEAELRLSTTLGRLLIESRLWGTINVSKQQLRFMEQTGLITRKGRALKITPHGFSTLNRVTKDKSRARSSREDVETLSLEIGSQKVELAFNHGESPLGQLYRRRGVNGRRPFLSSNEFAAGERLRADFTRGNLMPYLGVNWEMSVNDRNHRLPNSAAELSDAALAARLRVENAIVAVGPEFASVLVDVCCFLKGLETVERERLWPARSAKLLLKAALSALDRHYRPCPTHSKDKGEVILHWGTQDYRPAILPE